MDKNKKTKEKTERIWVKQFNKYMDELTPEEWNAMTNAHCDDPLKGDC